MDRVSRPLVGDTVRQRQERQTESSGSSSQCLLDCVSKEEPRVKTRKCPSSSTFFRHDSDSTEEPLTKGAKRSSSSVKSHGKAANVHNTDISYLPPPLDLVFSVITNNRLLLGKGTDVNRSGTRQLPNRPQRIWTV